MSTCIYCGEEIEFRYVGGRPVPIHPGGGWQCGSHVNDSGGTSTSYYDYACSRTHEWRFQDQTRPTICPECGANVFFIRHNGGSVWLDDLGWPWPKHACFDEPHARSSKFSKWVAKTSGFQKAKLGVVSCIRPGRSEGAEKFVEITLGNATKVGLFLQWMPEHSMIGALVALAFEDKLLLHEQHGEIGFHGLVEISTAATKKAVIQCPDCTAYIIEKNLDYHRKTNCTKSHAVNHATVLTSSAARRNSAKLLSKAIIQAEVVRIISAARKAAACEPKPIARFQRAKKEALRMIQSLPPELRGKVEKRFEDQRWEGLLFEPTSEPE